METGKRVATLTLLCIPSDRPLRLTEFLFALPDNLHARVFFVRLGVDAQQAAMFFLLRVAVGEQTLIRLLYFSVGDARLFAPKKKRQITEEKR